MSHRIRSDWARIVIVVVGTIGVLVVLSAAVFVALS